jgi:uncharacterized protein
MTDKGYLGADIKKLGFGLMRLPQLGDDIDIEQVKKMVDLFMAKGFTYFDTAYGYNRGKSEMAVKEAIVKRYPRESFQLATKMPIWEVSDKADMPKMLQLQLERTGAGFFDFYMLHHLADSRYAAIEKYDAWSFLKSLKEKGIARNVGFSFHDKAAKLDELLAAHPWVDFVQLQINYIDWDSPDVQARANYETARRHNKPITVMEPVKGGALAAMAPTVRQVLKEANPAVSPASWAIRFAASLDGLITVLSGMSSLAQMQDNLSFMADFKPLSDRERTVLSKVVEMLNAVPTVPCTACKYCVEHCPQGINIPEVIAVLNGYKVFEELTGARRNYGWATMRGGKASSCIACGACEDQCPQNIGIIETMKDCAKLFE